IVRSLNDVAIRLTMKLNWGIIGAGKIADRQMAPAIALAQDQQLIAVMRRDLAQAQTFATRHGAQRAYDSVEALLADEAINVVYVATPPHLHAEQTILAAQHGKHVLCEKPMALNTTQAQQMIEACDKHNVRLMICYYQRFNSRHLRIKQLLAEGAIGQVTAARISFSEYFPPQPGVWHHDPVISGGGPLMDLATHCIDLISFLCGPAVEVSAFVDTLAADSLVEDTATLLLRLQGGVQAVVTTHWSTANHDPERFNRLEIYGTEGTIVAAPIQAKDSSGTLQVITADGTQDFGVEPGGPRPHVALLDSFAGSINDDIPVSIPGEDGLAGLAVVEAAVESARSGRRIVLRN
ncbi:Gfo/Idh/MocA family oxidoreductase, partial [Chloroflexi bacterium TSY]|nr:Gfo/Idh/MocA family oxidoreductase [Chloroflexi bacterium TSY]